MAYHHNDAGYQAWHPPRTWIASARLSRAFSSASRHAWAVVAKLCCTWVLVLWCCLCLRGHNLCFKFNLILVNIHVKVFINLFDLWFFGQVPWWSYTRVYPTWVNLDLVQNRRRADSRGQALLTQVPYYAGCGLSFYSNRLLLFNSFFFFFLCPETSKLAGVYTMSSGFSLFPFLFIIDKYYSIYMHMPF